MWRLMSPRTLCLRAVQPPVSLQPRIGPLLPPRLRPPSPPLTSTSCSFSHYPSLPPVCSYSTGSGGGHSSRRGSSRRRPPSSSTSSSSPSSDPPHSFFSSPSLLLALFRALPSAARVRVLFGGGLLLAVCGGLVVLVAAALPYIVLPLIGFWAVRRIYRWSTQSSASSASPFSSGAPSSPFHSSASSSASTSSPFSSFFSSSPSSWSAVLSSPLSFLSSLSSSSVLSSLSSSFDIAISAAVAHPRVRSLLGVDSVGGGDVLLDGEVEVEVESQQARVLNGRVAGAVVLHVSSARTGRSVQLDVGWERLTSDSSAGDGVRLTRLSMRQDGSVSVEQLSVDYEYGGTKSYSVADVIDVDYEVTSERQQRRQAADDNETDAARDVQHNR